MGIKPKRSQYTHRRRATASVFAGVGGRTGAFVPDTRTQHKEKEGTL